MDGESPNQETSDSTETTNQIDTNNNNNQAEEPGLIENKDPEIEHSVGEAAEAKVGGGEEETTAPEKDGGVEPSTDDTDKPQTASMPDAEEAGQDKVSTDSDVRGPELINGEKEGQGDVEEDKKEVTTLTYEEEVEDKCKDEEKSKTEGELNEEEKDVSGKAAKDAEKKKQDVEVKDKEKTKEAEKQGKPKRKSGPPSSSLSRPRQSARSIRAAARNDIIAKFQQGAPETPVPRNFKIQKSSAAVTTGASIKQKMLQWCRNKTRNYEGLNIENFSSSWCDGLAFCALIHRFFPDAFDYSSLNPKDREKNFTLAFQTAESLADCCPLLEVSDMLMMGNNPDPMCVFTYVQSLCHSLSKIEKERKDQEKEDKEKTGNEGEDKGEDTAGDLSAEKDEEKPAEDRKIAVQEEIDGAAETEGAGEKKDGEDSVGESVEA